MFLIKKNHGAALLLAMLVMAGVLTVSVATSKLVINEVVQSYQLDKAMVAFYAAESGIERSLFQARQKDFDAAGFNALGKTLPNQAAYQLIAKDNEEILYISSLKADDSYQVDLFEPHSLNVLENPIKAVSLSWQGNGWLEAKWTPWTSLGDLDNPQGLNIPQTFEPYFIPLYDSNAYLYRLRIIARVNDASSLEIKAYNRVDPANCEPSPDACLVNIPARVSIKSLGEYPKDSSQAARQAILVTMPERSPLSGLYDYVLYSEEEIKKEN